MQSFVKSSIARTLVTRMRITRVLAMVALAGTFTAACERKADITGPGALFSITVTPNPQTLAVNGTQQFTAVGKDANGAVVTFTPTWSIVSSGGAINATTGLFTAGTASGTFSNTVKATSGTVSGTATVTVNPGPLASIVVSPNPMTLAVGAQQQYTAVGKDAFGNAVTITPVWTTAAGGGTIVGTTGMFTAGTLPGLFTNTITATSGTIAGTATVTVTAGALATIVVTPNPATLDPGAAQTFTAVGKDASGNVVAITPAWSVVNGGGAINATSGAFTAGAIAGTFANTVKATSGTISGTATVNVNSTATALATITVSPNPASVGVNAAQTFTAVGRDGSGNVVAITPVWSVVSGGGTIDAATGVFTAGAVTGSFANTVKASSGSISGTATVNVTSPATSLATIEVTPNPATVASSANQQFTAVGRDGNGNIIAITPAWAVVNGGGTIGASNGFFTAAAVTTTGTFTNTVRASSGGVSGFATVTVTAPPGGSSIVNLGNAAPNGIMAGTAVTCATGSVVNADVSISPGNTITGPCSITGTQHLGDPTAARAQIDLTSAYNTLKGLPCPPANAIVADLGGTTKAAGVYCTASGIGATGVVTLDGGGDPNATFVFQAGTSLTTAGDVVLINGAQAKNVFWVVGSSATLGTASQWQGNVIALTSITLVTGANLQNGRALARNGAVVLGTGSHITLP